METNISMQQLKEQRMTPAEKFVLETIKGAKPDEPSKNGKIVWRNKYGSLFVEKKSISSVSCL